MGQGERREVRFQGGLTAEEATDQEDRQEIIMGLLWLRECEKAQIKRGSKGVFWIEESRTRLLCAGPHRGICSKGGVRAARRAEEALPCLTCCSSHLKYNFITVLSQMAGIFES